MYIDKTEKTVYIGAIPADIENCHEVDERTELAHKIIMHVPYFDFVLDNEGNLVDMTPLPRPEPEPTISEPTTEEILLTALMEIQELKFKIAELEGKK